MELGCEKVPSWECLFIENRDYYRYTGMISKWLERSRNGSREGEIDEEC